MPETIHIEGRCFVVGCARSGTTLLQTMLASHSRVFSFPESHFFCSAVPHRRRYRLLGLADRCKAQRALRDMLKTLERNDLEVLIPRYSPMIGAYGRAFRRIVDQVCRDCGRTLWVEKTPHHIDYIPIIERAVHEAKFVHILRDGRDVLASQIHAMSQAPGYWGNWSLLQLTRVWNNDIRNSLLYTKKQNHILISYEQLLDSPGDELTRLCRFLGIDFEPQMLRHWEAADAVVGWRSAHPWMQGPFEPLQDTRLRKFRQIFTKEEQHYVETHLLWGGKVGALLGEAMDTTMHAGQQGIGLKRRSGQG